MSCGMKRDHFCVDLGENLKFQDDSGFKNPCFQRKNRDGVKMGKVKKQKTTVFLV